MNYYKALTSVNIAAVGKIQKDDTCWLTPKEAAHNLKEGRIFEIVIPVDCIIFKEVEDVNGYVTRTHADQ